MDDTNPQNGDAWHLDTDTMLPAGWDTLQSDTNQAYFKELLTFLHDQGRTETILPPAEHIFAALEATPLEQVKVLVVGQDPYHNIGQAHGLCFSVLPGVKLPPSLKNIYKELQADLGYEPVDHGYLMSWARQGVLLLNTVLTVQAHQANSHRKRGWETFTDTIIRKVSAKEQPVVFVLWGNPAQKKKSLIDGERHVIIESPHPSPLSAHRGFFGSQPFSKVNQALREAKLTEIAWQLPNAPDLD